MSRFSGTLCIMLFLYSCSYSREIHEQQTALQKFSQDILALTEELYQLTEKMNKNQQELESLRFELGVLRKELFELRSPSISPELSQSERLAKYLQELSNPQCDTNKLAFELRRFGKRAVIALLELLKKPDPDFRYRVEKTFSGLLTEDAIPLLVPYLNDTILRTSAARILGNLKDPSVVNYLSDSLTSEDESFVFTLAEALVKLKDKRGVPVLIEYLKKADAEKRAIAFQLLYKITGQTLDYKYYAEMPEVTAGAKKWEEWWLKNASTFTFPPE
jgi:HEAT repeat protein